MVLNLHDRTAVFTDHSHNNAVVPVTAVTASFLHRCNPMSQVPTCLMAITCYISLVMLKPSQGQQQHKQHCITMLQTQP